MTLSPSWQMLHPISNPAMQGQGHLLPSCNQHLQVAAMPPTCGYSPIAKTGANLNKTLLKA